MKLINSKRRIGFSYIFCEPEFVGEFAPTITITVDNEVIGELISFEISTDEFPQVYTLTSRTYDLTSTKGKK